LLHAGARRAAGDDELLRDVTAVGRLARAVPALKVVADAGRSLTAATAQQAGPAFLDLLLIVRQAVPLLASAGLDGDPEPTGASGPWGSPLPAGEAAELAAALTRKTSKDRVLLRTAAKQGIAADLRLVGPALDATSGTAGQFPDLVTAQVLPGFGDALPGLLRESINLRGDAGDARRLALLCRCDPGSGADLCRRALTEASAPVLARVVAGLRTVLPKPEAVPALREALRHPSGPVREAAVISLAGLGASVAPLCAAWLQEPEERVRLGAALVLARRGKPDRVALPALVAALRDRSDGVRTAVTRALIPFGPDAHGAAADLCELLPRTRSEAFREAAVEALEALQADAHLVVPALVALLPDDRWSVRRRVLAALKALGPDAEEAAPALWRLLCRNQYVAEPVAEVLVALEAGACRLLPELLTAVGRVKSPVRAEAARVLAAVAPFVDPGQLCGPLADLLGNATEGTLGLTLYAVMRLGSSVRESCPGLKAAVPRLCEVAVGGYDWVNHNAQEVVRILDPAGDVAVPELRKHLRSPDTAENVLYFLEEYASPVAKQRLSIASLGPHSTGSGWSVSRPARPSPAAVAVWADALRHPEKEVRRIAAEKSAIIRRGNATIVKELRRLLRDDPDPRVRLAAGQSLFVATGETDELLALLGPLLRGDADLRDALMVLREVGPAAAAVAPALRDLLRRRTDYLRAWAAHALAAVAPGDPVVLEYGRQQLRSRDAGDRGHAVQLLGKLRPAPAQVLPFLRKALQDPAEQVRGQAANALGLLDPPPRQAARDLLPLLEEGPTPVYRPAALALLRLGEQTRPALAALSGGWLEKPETRAGHAREVSGSSTSYRPLYVLTELTDEPGAAKEALAAALGDEEWPVRCLAAVNLALLWEERVPECVSVLVESVREEAEDGRLFLRVQAARALARLGPLAAEALPALGDALPRLRSWRLRAEVRRAIAWLRAGRAAEDV
jgi:HEAT repeat protein